MRSAGFYWGILGVTGIIASAVFRLYPRILELDIATFSTFDWLLLVLFTPFMAYSEGYKGFHLNFAPRVVARALYLRESRQLLLHLLAPLFCMGYFYATRRRQLTSILVTSAIVLLVLTVSRAPQPLRGIIDFGVVTGLLLGIASLCWHWLRFEFAAKVPTTPADLPA